METFKALLTLTLCSLMLSACAEDQVAKEGTTTVQEQSTFETTDFSQCIDNPSTSPTTIWGTKWSNTFQTKSGVSIDETMEFRSGILFHTLTAWYKNSSRTLEVTGVVSSTSTALRIKPTDRRMKIAELDVDGTPFTIRLQMKPHRLTAEFTGPCLKASKNSEKPRYWVPIH